MSEYTPTEAQVRAFWVSGGNEQPAAKSCNRTQGLAEFDRFIAKVRADALREAADEFQARLPDGTGNGRAYNSYRVSGMLDARARQIEQEASDGR